MIDFYETYHDPFIGGLTVGRKGSKGYILNNMNVPISRGYQQFYLSNGTLMGIIGGDSEIVFYKEFDADDFKDNRGKKK